MTGNQHNHLVHFLAPARIAGYRSFLKFTTNEEVRRAYAWNYAISAMVFPLLGCVEMHLRDAIHRVMSQRYAPAGRLGIMGILGMTMLRCRTIRLLVMPKRQSMESCETRRQRQEGTLSLQRMMWSPP